MDSSTDSEMFSGINDETETKTKNAVKLDLPYLEYKAVGLVNRDVITI